MSNFSRQRAPGFWFVGSVVLSTEFEFLDAILPKLPNFAEGSTHAPSSVITIGGSGLTVSGPFSAPDASITIPASKTLTIAASGTLSMAASSVGTFAGTVTVPSGGTLALGAGSVLTQNATSTWTLSGVTTLANPGVITFGNNTTLNCNSGSTINFFSGSGFSCGGTATFSAGLTLSGTITQSGAYTQTGGVEKSGDNAQTGCRTAELAAGTATIQPVKDIHEVPDSRGANFVYTLGATPAPKEGQLWHFTGGTGPVSAHTVGFKMAGDPTVMIEMPASLLSWITFRWKSAISRWIPFNWAGNANFVAFGP